MPEIRPFPLMEVRNLTKFFPIERGSLFRKKLGDLRALDGISFHISRGETLGLVGESGCGKTTAGRTILRLESPTSGQIIFDGRDISNIDKYEARKLRRNMQIIYQDPYGSLNPRMTVRDIIGEPLLIHELTRDRGEYRDRVDSLLELVGLNPAMALRYPHEFSGGQRQRIGIARAIALNPDFIVCDEPVSALDVSIQAQIINLMEDLQKRLGMAYLFIAHDLAVVRHISDRVAVMYLGEIVEIAAREDLYSHPAHPYTKALLAAVPIPDPDTEYSRGCFPIRGEVPSLFATPAGCKFHTRCTASMKICSETRPSLGALDSSTHLVACHRCL